MRTGVDFLADRHALRQLAKKTVYTGRIDAYFDGVLGKLAYRGLRLENEVLEEENHQGVAVMNYTDAGTPYTRIIEHKHFAFGKQPKTVITREYPAEWEEGMEPFYPVNDAPNTALYEQYAALAAKEKDVLFLGRLAEYRYYDMDDAIAAALTKAGAELGGQEA